MKGPNIDRWPCVDRLWVIEFMGELYGPMATVEEAYRWAQATCNGESWTIRTIGGWARGRTGAVTQIALANEQNP